jgi:NAD-dependent dihydropyrimidine dehydrogenase PreA subunit
MLVDWVNCIEHINLDFAFLSCGWSRPDGTTFAAAQYQVSTIGERAKRSGCEFQAASGNKSHFIPVAAVRRLLSDLEQTMAHVIAQPCIGTKDTSCVEVCPVDCIHPLTEADNHETAEQLYIDPDVCIDCGLCVDECPVQAIFPQEDLPAEWSDFIEKNAKYFEDNG